jgi:L-threonylcarbamoyladenylate synthase
LPGEAYLAFGKTVPTGGAKTENLSPTGDLTEAAANLFVMLRALDSPEYQAIAVAPIPDEGLGRAINDRLRRAATPA